MMADTPDTGIHVETTSRLSKYQQLYKADISVRCCGHEAGTDRVSKIMVTSEHGSHETVLILNF